MIEPNRERMVNVKVHNYPPIDRFSYDWAYIENILKDNQCIHVIDKQVFAIKAKDIVNLFGPKYAQDQLQFLEHETRLAFMRKSQGLQRRVREKDFYSFKSFLYHRLVAYLRTKLSTKQFLSLKRFLKRQK